MKAREFVKVASEMCRLGEVMEEEEDEEEEEEDVGEEEAQEE